MRPTMRIRPRFSVLIDGLPEVLDDTIKSRLSEEDFTVVGQAMPGHLTLLIPVNNRKWWSPRLTISIEKEDNRSRVRGMYSPDPGLWTMFMFLYSVFGFGFVIALMWGSSQWALDQGISVLIYAVILLVLFGGTWLVARFGRRLSYDQIKELHSEAEQIFGQEINQ